MTVWAGEQKCPECFAMVKSGAEHVCLRNLLAPPLPMAHAFEDRGWSDTDRPYYDTPGGLKAIDVIEAFAKDNFLRGTALKYLLRAGRKGDRATDLRKAVWYIQREIENADR